MALAVLLPASILGAKRDDCRPNPISLGRLTPKTSGATPEQPKSYSGEPPSVPAHSRGSHTLGFFPSLLLSFTLGRLPRVCAVQ